VRVAGLGVSRHIVRRWRGEETFDILATPPDLVIGAERRVFMRVVAPGRLGMRIVAGKPRRNR
jgi:hypothetical protein